ncbi:MAG: AarF/ABC1/UbiB kinase family protein [Sandaracinaceae bacterium]|nr:AarF/ABC1/UbiB kinase family protein [Sandaracinaceae bacterium]
MIPHRARDPSPPRAPPCYTVVSIRVDAPAAPTLPLDRAGLPDRAPTVPLAAAPGGPAGRGRARAAAGRRARRDPRAARRDLREVRADPREPPRSARARLHRGAREAAGRRPPAPFETVETVLAEELGELRERIEHVEREPIAAASVAQVHEGRLSSGERVAIKVQRPEARSQIERDLAILAMGARVLDLVPSLHLLSLPGSVAQFGEALSAQLDFRLEAENNRRLGANFATIKGVRVPDLHPELCTERVLTMELIVGVRATHPELIKEKKVRRRLAARGGEAILRMIFEDGFVRGSAPGTSSSRTTARWSSSISGWWRRSRTTSCSPGSTPSRRSARTTARPPRASSTRTRRASARRTTRPTGATPSSSSPASRARSSARSR